MNRADFTSRIPRKNYTDPCLFCSETGGDGRCVLSQHSTRIDVWRSMGIGSVTLSHDLEGCDDAESFHCVHGRRIRRPEEGE